MKKSSTVLSIDNTIPWFCTNANEPLVLVMDKLPVNDTVSFLYVNANEAVALPDPSNVITEYGELMDKLPPTNCQLAFNDGLQQDHCSLC